MLLTLDMIDLPRHLTDSDLEILKYRRTGRSTAQALECIALAIRNPKKTIKVFDHYGTKESNKLLLHRIKDTVLLLKLSHFVFDRTENSITFDWDNPVVEYIARLTEAEKMNNDR